MGPTFAIPFPVFFDLVPACDPTAVALLVVVFFFVLVFDLISFVPFDDLFASVPVSDPFVAAPVGVVFAFALVLVPDLAGVALFALFFAPAPVSYQVVSAPLGAFFVSLLVAGLSPPDLVSIAQVHLSDSGSFHIPFIFFTYPNLQTSSHNA